MKKILLTFAFASLFSWSQAQDQAEYRRFRVDFNLGWALPVKVPDAKGGGVIALEPKYAVVSNLLAGVKVEAGYFMLKDTDTDRSDNITPFGSYLGTVDYYLINGFPNRAFVGGGLGAFIYDPETRYNTAGTIVTTPGAQKFGGMIRAGIEKKAFRLVLEFNFAPKNVIQDFDAFGNASTSEQKYTHLSIKTGFRIGGAPK